MQQPDAPSFYWPLTDLPRPFIDLRKPMQGERAGVYGSFPGADRNGRRPQRQAVDARAGRKNRVRILEYVRRPRRMSS